MCEENNSKSDRSVEYSFEENYMITCFRKSDIRLQRSLLRYFELLSLEKREDKSSTDLERNVTVIRDADGNHIALKGPRRVAKANAAQAIPELIQIALPAEKLWQENQEKKHAKDAKFGWYRYKIRFGIPVYNNEGVLERYNIFTAIMLVRHAEDGKKYLYDFTTIKKETSSPPES